MEFILTVFLFILILGFLIFIHELGHFTAAKLSGIPVIEFAIGFGPILIERHYKGTHYRLRALPLGGFVNLEGENSDKDPNGFRNRSFPIKFFVLIAGIVMNFLTAIVLLAIFLGSRNNVFFVENFSEYNFSNVENQYSFYPIIIYDADTDYGWEGFSDELIDTIVELDGNKIENVADFLEFIDNNRGESLNATFLNIDNLELTESVIKIGDLPYGYLPSYVTNVEPTSRSYGIIEEGERIVGINETFFTKRGDFLNALNENKGTTATFSFISENGEIYTKDIELADVESSILEVEFVYDDGLAYDAMSDSKNDIYFIKYNSNILAPVSMTYDVSVYQLKSLGSMVSNSVSSGDFSEVSNAVGGPVSVGGVVGQVVDSGLYDTLIPLTAFISISLAVFNILPLPALDGGQIVLSFVETVRRKKISDEWVNRINLAGFAFIIILSILIFVKDIHQYNVVGDIIEKIRNIFGK